MNNEIYIIACNSYLPERLKIDYDALGISNEEAQALGYSSVTVEPKLFPTEMASLAIEPIFHNTKLDKKDVINICHTYIHRHGNNVFWSPASHLQKKHNLVNAIPFNLSQGCNSQLLAIDLLRKQLDQENPNKTILITSGDRFSITKFDRYKGDYGIFYGDAATAVLIGKTPGIAKILCTHTISAPELEGLHNAQCSAESEDTLQGFYDVRSTKKAYLEKHGRNALMDITRKSVSELASKVSLHCKQEEIAYFIFPNLGSKLLEDNYYPIFPSSKGKTLADFGKTTGHMAANDGIAGLDYLLKSKKAKKGDKVLMLGAGAGFTWSMILLEIQ